MSGSMSHFVQACDSAERAERTGGVTLYGGPHGATERRPIAGGNHLRCLLA